MFKTHGAQQFAQKLQPATRIILIKLLVQATDIETGANELRCNLERVRAGFWILKRSSIGGDRSVKILRDIAIEWQALTFDQPENDFRRGRRVRIHVNDVTVTRVTRMVVDVDPNFRRPNGAKRGSEPALNCRVERNGTIEVFRGRRRLGYQFRARKERILLKHSFFIPHSNILSELLKRKRKRKLAAERVSIRTDVTHHRKALMLAQYPADFLENLDDASAALDGIVEMKSEMWRIFHGDVPGKFSLQCRAMGREFA